MIIKGKHWVVKAEPNVEKKLEVIKKAEKKVIKEVPKETTVVEEKNELDELLSKLDKENK